MISADDVARVRFTPTRFRAGYDQGDVDRFLAKTRDTLALYEHPTGGSAALSADDVVRSRFQPTKYRSGYDQTEVDDFLDKVVVALRAYEANRPKLV